MCPREIWRSRSKVVGGGAQGKQVQETRMDEDELFILDTPYLTTHEAFFTCLVGADAAVYLSLQLLSPRRCSRRFSSCCVKITQFPPLRFSPSHTPAAALTCSMKDRLGESLGGLECWMEADALFISMIHSGMAVLLYTSLPYAWSSR